MGDKVISLSRRYGEHGQTFDSVTLREPKLRDYLAIGEPVEIQPNGDGGRMVVEYNDRVEGYFQRLVKVPGFEMIQDLDLVDAIAIKDAILDFFKTARLRRDAPTNSSSAPAIPSAM